MYVVENFKGFLVASIGFEKCLHFKKALRFGCRQLPIWHARTTGKTVNLKLHDCVNAQHSAAMGCSIWVRVRVGSALLRDQEEMWGLHYN